MRLLALCLLAGAFLAAACGGGDDDDRTAGIIHRILTAARAGDTDALESFSGALPDDLPVEPPLYPDADIIVSSREPGPAASADADPDSPRAILYFIVLDTEDGRGDVFVFYEGELDEGVWQLESAFSTPELDTLLFSQVDDPDVSGVVAIAQGGGDGTSILISLQDAGATEEDEPPFELGTSRPLPKEFPDEVPVIEGATVTSTAFNRAPGTESFLLIILTMESQSDVMDFYRAEFEEMGWTVQDSGAGLGDRIDFRDDSGDIQGDITADRFSLDRDYTEVSIQVFVNPASRPPDDDEPEDEEESGS